MSATVHENLDEAIGESSVSRIIPLPTALKPSKRDISPSFYNKLCDLCHNSKDVLIRCRIDETRKWHFVCTGKCWRQVSGGEIDGPDMPFYQYGGMWKNKHAGVSAKKPKAKKKQQVMPPEAPT